MSWKNRVAWSQGMFLQPHHFQQEGRYFERALDAARMAVSPNAWGFARLEIDESALAIGRIAISSASGILPDGTPFSFPMHERMPAPLEIPADLGNELVYLGAPIARQAGVEFDYGDAADPALARFQIDTIDVRDQSSVSSETAAIQVARLNLRLLRGKDATDAYAVIGVARVKERRSDLQVVLDHDFIPAQLSIGATRHLAGEATWLRGMLGQRAESIAGRLGQLSHGVSELADFLQLQTLNRYEPLFAQFAQLARHHPQPFYEACLQMAGDLATLLDDRRRRPPAFPPYRHDDLSATFAPVFTDLRRLLSNTVQSNVEPIKLIERRQGVCTASIADTDLLRTATFVLAVNAELPGEQLRTRFLAISKIAPQDKLVELVKLQLPGIVARQLAVAPRQLPYHGGFHYFELERGSELWRQFERSGNLAIHVPDEFPGLQMELWAIRK